MTNVFSGKLLCISRNVPKLPVHCQLIDKQQKTSAAASTRLLSHSVGKDGKQPQSGNMPVQRQGIMHELINVAENESDPSGEGRK